MLTLTHRKGINKTTTMRKLRFNKYFLSALLVLAIAAGCTSPKKLGKNFEKMEFKSEPEVLEVHGDSIAVSIKGKIPAKTFHKKAVIKFQPILRHGENETQLKTMYLQGEKVKDKKGKTIKYAKGGTFTYTDKIAYTPEMKKSKLSLDYQIKIASKYEELDQCINGRRDSATRGTIITSLTVKPTDDILMFRSGVDDESDEAIAGRLGKRVTFYYVINEGKLRDTAKKGPAARMMRDLVMKSDNLAKAPKGKAVADTAGAKSKAGNKITGVVFRSYASPDGELSFNTLLTKQRANSSYDYVRRELKRMGLKGIYDTSFVKQPDMGEDWNGLKKLIAKSDLSDKNEINTIINSDMALPEKEAALRKLTSWDALKNDYLPKLRRTEVYFQGLASGPRTIEEIREATKDNFDDVTQEEMNILASGTEDWAEVERIYQAYVEKYPNDWKGKNNYAAAMLKNGSQSINNADAALNSNPKIDQAATLLEELSKSQAGNDTISNNLAVARRFQRKYNDAKGMYASAQGNGLKENNNLGIINIKMGDYNAATSSFEPTRCDYNVALAYTLKGEYDEALKRIECIQDKKAEDFYLRAIIGARKNDKTLMTTALTRAVQMDTTIRDRAKDDLEFRNFWETAEFQNALR